MNGYPADWNQRTPAQKREYRLNQTNMALAKKGLGHKCAIQGNVPSSLMVIGSPADVKAYCRKLIETCGIGGEYLMAAGCIAENPKLENLRAMIEAIGECGVYR
jgi:uroporphyrinogen-III decarboxylase